MPTLPTRTPDFHIKLWKYRLAGWQEDKEFVVVVPLKDGKELIIAQLGKYDVNDKSLVEEINYTIFNKLLTNYIK